MKLKFTMFDSTGRERTKRKTMQINNVDDVRKLLKFLKDYDWRWEIDVEEVIEQVKTYDDVIKREG